MQSRQTIQEKSPIMKGAYTCAGIWDGREGSFRLLLEVWYNILENRKCKDEDYTEGGAKQFCNKKFDYYQ